MALATLLAGLLPAAIAWVGQLIVDAVVAAIQAPAETKEAATRLTLFYVLCEAGLVIFMTGVQRRYLSSLVEPPAVGASASGPARRTRTNHTATSATAIAYWVATVPQAEPAMPQPSP